MEEGTCPVWKQRAYILNSGTAGLKVRSNRTAGDYRITREALSQVDTLPTVAKTLLTTWLVERRRFGDPAPIITNEAIRAAALRVPLRYGEQEDRLLLALAKLGYARPGASLLIASASRTDEYTLDMAKNDQLMAAVEVANRSELVALINFAEMRGLVSMELSKVKLLPDGFARLAEIETGGAATRQAFVAMWFDESMREAWRLGFAPAIRDAGYNPFRIDALHHNGKIDDAIVAEIKKSRFLIADFTCPQHDVAGRPKPVGEPRGGVYYEAGLAHGLGMEVVFTCRADRMDHLHFDTRQFAHIVWSTHDDLREQLYNRIAATLNEAPGAPGRGKGAVDPPDT